MKKTKKNIETTNAIFLLLFFESLFIYKTSNVKKLKNLINLSTLITITLNQIFLNISRLLIEKK